MSRNNVVDLLGVSQWTVFGWERSGRLTPARHTRQDTSGALREVVVYDPIEVAKLPRARAGGNARDPGELAARAFEMFDEGKSIRECVVELREMPDKIRELREKWEDGGGADLVISPDAKHALEDTVGPFRSVAELVELVVARAAKPES